MLVAWSLLSWREKMHCPIVTIVTPSDLLARKNALSNCPNCHAWQFCVLWGFTNTRIVTIKKGYLDDERWSLIQIAYMACRNDGSLSPVGLVTQRLESFHVGADVLSREGLLCWFPLATNGRHDGTLFLQLSKSLVHFLTVGTQCLRHVACRDGFACLAHSL